MFFYEDLPYCENQEKLQSAIEKLGSPVSAVVQIDVERKIKAIECYRSQLKPLFQGPAQMRARVRAYASKVGDSVEQRVDYAERVWRIG